MIYLTISKIADFLSMDESYVTALILQGRIRALHDGEQFIINSEQFTHLEHTPQYEVDEWMHLN